MREDQAIKKCAEWLAGCLKSGWDKKHLDGLQRIWWEHHDEQGNLIKLNSTPNPEGCDTTEDDSSSEVGTKK